MSGASAVMESVRGSISVFWQKGGSLAESNKTRKVNREGQRWTEDRAGITLRLPIELREAVTEESRIKGGLSRVVLFALAHVNRKEAKITQTRKAGHSRTLNFFTIGAEAREALKEWAEEGGVSVNAIVVSVLEEFFRRLKKRRALRTELQLEIEPITALHQ